MHSSSHCCGALLLAVALLVGCAVQSPQGHDDDPGDPPIVGVSEGGSDSSPPDDHPDPPPAYEPCPAEGDQWFEEIVASFTASLQADAVPGGAVAVVCGGRLTHARGIGDKHMNGGEPISEHTRFQWASITKMFTGTAAAMLMVDGTLDAHAPLSTLFPWYPQADFTSHQLLTHTAGFPEMFASYSFDLQSTVQANVDMPMDGPPGGTWNYSNPGFAVAGLVVEQVSGQPYAQVIQQQVMDPTGATMTMAVATVAAGDFSYGHSQDYGPLEALPPSEPLYGDAVYAPMGGAWGSVRDLARWGEIHLHDGDGVLPAEALALARTSHATTSYGGGYGYGMFVIDDGGRALIHHGGSVAGFVSEWVLVPEAGFGVFMLANADWFYGSVTELALSRFAP
ncbi:MAG: beta-lactamase family protein [Deltaproteobacteria bacterium]|nr:beta-lactamase family protein [Deltaproteobacteria bacterium]